MKSRILARKTLDAFGEYRVYFLRGYQLYIALAITIYSHSLIIYNYSIKNIGFLSWIERFIVFFVVFITLLISGAILLGKFDYRKGTYKKEVEVIAAVNPIWQRVFKEFKDQKEQLENITERLEELEKKIRKGAEEH